MSNEAEVTVRQQRRPRSEIAQLVTQFAGSGLTRSGFCRRHGLCLGTLNRYLPPMRRSNPGLSDGLVAVELASTSSGNAVRDDHGLAVVLAGGRRIEVSAGFDASTLERLVALLEKL